MVIIEGPDSSGKSTLVKTLSARIPYATVKHNSGPAPASVMIKDMDELLEQWYCPIICDRIRAISELVYGTVMRGQSVIPHKYLTRIISLQIPIIYCRPPASFIMSPVHEHREEESDEHTKAVERHHRSLVAQYDRVMSELPHIHYDFMSWSPDQLNLLVDYIRATLRLQEKEQWELQPRLKV